MAVDAREAGSAVARRDELVLAHIPLARSLARRFANRGETFDDLAQVAMVGLVNAATRFDEDRGVAFSTYATSTISGELKRHFRDKRWGLHVGRSAKERYLLVRDAREWATEDLGRSPTLAEIAERAGISVEDVLEVQEVAAALRVGSIDVPLGSAEHKEPTTDLGTSDAGFGAVDDRLTVDILVKSLPARQREIIHLRFVEEMTQAQIAAELGVSQMQVSRILAKVLDDLRRAAAGRPTRP